jgi:hypothetical protein
MRNRPVAKSIANSLRDFLSRERQELAETNVGGQANSESRSSNSTISGNVVTVFWIDTSLAKVHQSSRTTAGNWANSRSIEELAPMPVDHNWNEEMSLVRMDRYWTRYSREFESAEFDRSEVIAMRPAQRRDTLAQLLESSGRTSRDDDDARPARRREAPSGVLRVRRFRRLPSLSEAAAAEKVSLNGLMAHRQYLVADLAVFDAPGRIRYAHEIRAACSELGPKPDRGIAIVVLVPSGVRISPVFAPEALGDVVYIWCTGDEKMMKEMVRPGTFVIVAESGKAIRLRLPLSEQIAGDRILLNVRLI